MKKTRSEAITVAWPKSAMATWPSKTPEFDGEKRLPQAKPEENRQRRCGEDDVVEVPAHPRPEQLARMAMSMLGRDRVEAVDLDPEDRISFPGAHRMIAHLALASLQEDSEARQGDLL